MTKLTEREIKLTNAIWREIHETLSEALDNGIINSEAFRKLKTTLYHKTFNCSEQL